MNVANQLTVGRIALALGVVWSLLNPGLGWHEIALSLFFLAILTDAADGYLARHLHRESPFGKVADPIADKLLVLGTLIALAKHRTLHIPLWGVVLILVREFLVAGLRILASAQQGRIISAQTWGKQAMAIQSACVLTILAILIIVERVSSAPAWLHALPYALTITAALSAWYSGFLYFRESRHWLEKSWE